MHLCVFHKPVIVLGDGLTLFILGFLWRPWTGGGASNAPLHFSKTVEDIDMKLTPLIKRREIILVLLSFLSCDVT